MSSRDAVAADAVLAFNQEQYLLKQAVARRGTRVPWPFHIAFAVELTGPLDVDALRAALVALTERHDALRTGFVGTSHAGYSPRVQPSATIPLEIRQVDGEPSTSDPEVAAVIDRKVLAPFQRDAPPLVRALLVRSAGPTSLLAFVAHHIICDGWSTRILVRDLEALYARCTGTPARIPPMRRSMADVAAWQRSQWESGRFDRSIAYWIDRWQAFHDAQLTYGDLPFSRENAGERKVVVGLQELAVGGEDLERIRTHMHATRTTMFMLMVAAFVTVVARATGRRRFALWANFCNRGIPGSEDTCGWLSNAHMLGIEVHPRMSAIDLQRHVRQVVLEAATHQSVPLPAVWTSLGKRLDTPNPRFMFQTLQAPWQGEPRSEVRFRQISRRNRLGNVDLALRVVDAKQHSDWTVAFSRSRFATSAMTRLLADMRASILEGAARPDATPLSA